MDFKAIGSTRVVVAPDRFRQIGMRHHVAGILHQMTEDVVLCYRQADFLFADVQLRSFRLKPQVSVGQDAFFRRCMPANHRLNTCQQLELPERFSDVIVSSPFQSFYNICFVRSYGKNNGRYSRKAPDLP